MNKNIETRSTCLAGIVLLAHAVYGISVQSTPSPYAASSPSNDYASPTTIEPATPDYNKFNNPHYPYSRQIYEPPYNGNQQQQQQHAPDNYAPSSSLLSPKPFILPRFPSFFGNPPPHSSPVSPPPEAPAYHYNLPSPYPTQSGFVPSYPSPPVYDSQYPAPYPRKYPVNPYAPSSCDYQHLSPFRNTKPLLFYPQKPENYYEYPVAGKPAEPLYRYQPAIPLYGSNFANNIYH